MKFRAYLLAAAVVALTGAAATAATVNTTTVVKQVDLPDTKTFDFKSFDTNNDQIITMTEVGDNLFFLFDLDSNKVIDNHEFETKSVLTVIPLEAKTYTFRDYDDDGKYEKGDFTYDVFAKQSGLAVFDEKRTGGIAPTDFVKASFLEMDKNDSKVIEPNEWRDAYVQSRLPDLAKQDTYNR